MTGWNLSGIAIPACCAGPGKEKCGAELSTKNAPLFGLPAACYELNQPGNVDCTTCPQKQVKDLQGKDAYLDGCCMPDSTCGYNVDATLVQGPKIGCVPPKTFNPTAGTSQACTPSGQPSANCRRSATDGGSPPTD